MVKEHTISFKVNETEKRKLEDDAKNRNMNLSQVHSIQFNASLNSGN